MPRKKSTAGTPPPPANKPPTHLERLQKRPRKPPSRRAAEMGPLDASQISLPVKRNGNPAWKPGVTPPGARPWQPGQSGNPGGQPKGMAELRRAARELTVEAIETLGEIMLDPWQPGAARVAAAGHLLDRGYGKVRNADEDVGDDDLELLSTSELDRYIIARATQLVKDKAGNYAPETKT